MILFVALIAILLPSHSALRADVTAATCAVKHGTCEETCGASDDTSQGVCTDQGGGFCCIPPEGSEVIITADECLAQSGHIENLGYCNNSDVRIAKVPGIAGRICCVPVVPRQTIAPAQCTSQGGTCAPIRVSGDACQSDQTLIGYCKDASVPDGRSVCCKKNTSDTATANGSTAANSGTSSKSSLNYTLLEKIPGGSSQNLGLTGYLSAIYKLAIWIVGLCALFMFLIGAFMYLLSAANTSKLSTAKGVMQDSLIGLVLALTSYLILYVINPDLVKLQLPSVSMPSSSSGTSSGTASSTASGPAKTPGAAWPDDSDIRKELSSAGVTFNKANCKTEGQAEACTSVAELGSPAISGLASLKAACTACGSIMVNGGTEYWLHGATTQHQKGNSTVDINRTAELLNYLRQNGQVVGQCSGRNIYSVNGAEYWDEDNNHFHANFTGQACRHS